MKFHIEIKGTLCNSWPVFTLEQGTNLHEFVCKDDITIELDLSNEPCTLGMRNKSFGENRVWDTKMDSHGNIVQDKTIQINKFLIDEVDIVDILPYITYTSIEQGAIHIHDQTIRFNGYWTFDINDNPYNWIIDVRTPAPSTDKSINYFSDYTVRDKAEQYKIMEKIRSLLDI